MPSLVIDAFTGAGGMSARLVTLRRLPVAVTNPGDAVLAESIGLRCTRCDTRWSAALGPFGDEIEAKDSRCPTCTENVPPAA